MGEHILLVSLTERAYKHKELHIFPFMINIVAIFFIIEIKNKII